MKLRIEDFGYWTPRIIYALAMHGRLVVNFF